jgi:hypothetical protein
VLKWLTVIGLAATPALIFGQTEAWAAGFGFHLDTWALGLVIALAGFAEGLLIVWLASAAPPRKLVLPLALSNAFYTVIYYFVVKLGWDAIMSIF